MDLAGRQAQVAKRNGLSVEQVQNLYALVRGETYLWKAVCNEIENVEQGARATLADAQEPLRLYRAQGELSGLAKLVMNIKQVVNSVDFVGGDKK